MNLELNAEIATKIMGWEEITGEEIVRRRWTSATSREPHLKRIWVHDEAFIGCEECGSLPDFSGDIATAMLVVDKLADRYWLRLQSPFEKGEPWHAGFTPLSTTGWNGRPDFNGSGVTPAEAICRAALAIEEG